MYLYPFEVLAPLLLFSSYLFVANPPMLGAGVFGVMKPPNPDCTLIWPSRFQSTISPLPPPLATIGFTLLQPRAYVGCDWCPVRIMFGELGSDLCFWLTHGYRLISQMNISWWSEWEAIILLLRGQHLKLFISPGWISNLVTLSFDCWPSIFCIW